MCIALPMQIVRAGELTALCRGRNGEEEVNMLMVGEQPVGAWVLSFLGWARDVISEEQAHEIDLALDGLQEIMDGAESIDVDRHFPGLGRSSAAAMQ
jgi:hydrogenase expression/formation protein HypC